LLHGIALLCHEAQNATELGNNNPVIIRKMCRTISSEQKKSVDPFPVSRKKVSIQFQWAKKIVDLFPVLTKKGIFCRSISVGAVDPFLVCVVDPFPEVVSIHFSRPTRTSN
jgi:hypothetical protein